MTGESRVRNYLRTHGVAWTTLYGARWLLNKIIRKTFDQYLMKIEKRRFLTGPETVSAQYNTAEENRRMWNGYDWSEAGEEWTGDVVRYKGLEPEVWKRQLIEEMLLRYIKPGTGSVLEIGPGGGRWTEVLLPLCDRLVAADISETCLKLCDKRFKDAKNLDCRLIRDGTLPFVPDGSVDRVWSYDVFVHINPTDTERYIGEFARVLRPDGIAIIHHPGDAKVNLEWFRSAMDGVFFEHLVKKYGLTMVEQNSSLPHKPGDVISVFKKTG